MLVTQAPIKQLLQHWQQQGLLTPLDRHFALELTRLQSRNEEVDADTQQQQESLQLLICALLSQRLSSQHTCLVINSINLENPLGENLFSASTNTPSCQISVNHQQLEQLISEFSFVGQSGDNKPLILELGRLYLNKYHYFETQVAAKLLALSQSHFQLDIASTRRDLDILFPVDSSSPTQGFNWQKIATATALTQALAVITGGPGTGKTTTVTKLLLLLLSQQSLTMKLVAPTGKAAARLTESIKGSKARLKGKLGDNQRLIDALNAIPEEASTLHRLLGVIPHSHRFRHHADNPLRLDLLVIDEASMVDLPMMHKIVSALPANARLILLGDQDQLASVEAGAVLADICLGLRNTQVNQSFNGESQGQINDAWAMRYSANQAKLIAELTGEDVSQYQVAQQNSFGDSLCMLRHSHRFVGDAGIGKLATAVNQADVRQIRQVIRRNYPELVWFQHQINDANAIAASDNAGKSELLEFACSAYQPYLDMIGHNQNVFSSLALSEGATDQAVNEHAANEQPAIYTSEQIIDSYNQFRLLCAMRSGQYGVDGINASMTLALQQKQLLKPQQEFYLGRPIIIQSNDYNLGLFNGDIGLILQDDANPSRLMAHFIQADGSILKVLPARLPKHDTCFAMTVHKSQGSEFDCVAFVLPAMPTTSQWQLLTKELVYTAITRAKSYFYCLGTAKVFERASTNITLRSSGLGERLWG
ncbi:exodeoxyribonuclease V subunit alpha [Shewanella maritima]|uniref:RecBCD enzyme subunit RecD n=1 Tax=Shewanella maritima TaxID=2520507 RepID=A0A411PDN0_9GAMM|nr:exodeoxyribonuclease V subunit alpha [Shewanella maritima]QBF81631.1 exodeoxyribonuclease V subunit alpha [Shewanella maritima]